jgi:hypothetical protein
MGNVWSPGITDYNSVKIPVSTTITSIDAGVWYCNSSKDEPSCNVFCAKAWQGGGKLNAAVALIAGSDCDDVDGITVYKGNNAKTNVKKLLPGDMMVISQVGPLKNVKPWVTSDKASISGAFFKGNYDTDDCVDDECIEIDVEEFWFIDNFVYYFDQAGFVTIAFTGSAGKTKIYDALAVTSTAKVTVL